MKIEIWQGIVAIIVALITGCAGGGTMLAKFLLERKDAKEKENVQKLIDEAVMGAKKEMLYELKKVSIARSQEGADRFETHAKAFSEVNKQIKETSEQVNKLSSLVTNLVDKMDSFAGNVGVLSESSCNSNYDRLLMVTNKILKTGIMTISDKTNLKNLYKSWKALGGKDDEMDTKYEECMQLKTALDDI